MTQDVNRMIRALADSFGSVERPGFDEDADRARLYERAHQAIEIARHKIQTGDAVAFELNVIVRVMELFGGNAANNVRGLAATLGASLGVKFPTLAA